MAEIIGHIGRAQTLTAELSTPQTITGSLCGGAAHGIPTGGEPGQGLIKVSDADYDVKWMDILPEDTASGSVASFPDGADDLPMGVVVDIDPVQDLHGYDNPWPGGGGKNKLQSPTATSKTVNGITISVSNGVYSIAGTATALAEIIFDLPFDVTLTSGSKTAYLNDAVNAGVTVYYRYNYTNLQEMGFGGGINKVSNTYTESRQANKIRFLVTSGTAISGTLHTSPMLIEGSETATAYAPYSNICPISGWDGAKVTRTGMNLFDPETFASGRSQYYTVNSDGSITVLGNDSSTWNDVVYIPLKAGTYTLSWSTQTSGQLRMKTSDDGYTTEKYIGANNKLSTFTLAADGGIKVKIGINATYPYTEYLQLELGSTAHSYEPYTAVIHEIPFSTEVYGGTLNVETGELVVDRKTDIADGSTIAIQGIYGNGTAYTRPIDGMYNDSAYAYQRVARILSDKLKASPFISIASNQYAVAHSGGNRAVFNIPTCTTEAEYNAWLSENRPQIVYYLATPITLTLTPTEIRSLLGDNNVWSDTGDVSVTYKADTKKYIDKKISAAVAAMS